MKTIGILGGMGPLATVDLFNKIVTMTSVSCDSDHIHILIDNDPQIPDRTDFILGKGINPTNKLINCAKKLESMGADFLVIPCNTAHYFYNFIQESVSIPVVNMIEETAKYIKNNFNTNKVGLISTTGTTCCCIYDEIFKKHGIEIIKPNSEGQDIIMNLIYELKKGNKNFNTNKIYSVLNYLKSKNCTHIILGCTELPVGFDILNIHGNFIDPTKILAMQSISLANGIIVLD